jgi:hypothetical protein
MTTEAFVGEWFVYRGDGASPEVFSKICNVTDLGGLGAQNALVEATNTCSDGSKEYIPGLADGAEFTLTTNYHMSDEVRGAMMDDVDNKATRHFQVRFENGSPTETYAFSVACLGWELQPSLTDPNRVVFTFKISGAITHP